MSSESINKIEIIPVQIALNEPFVISIGPLTHASVTVVKINTNDFVGIGECCPYRTIHSETQKGSVAAAQRIAKELIGKDPTEIHSLVSIMDKCISGPASIKGAFDMALYDLNAKMANVPLYKFLNGRADKEIYTDMTVSLLDKESMVKKAMKYSDDGFPVLKIKLGDSSSSDIERLHAIRLAIGEDFPLRVDANQGWSYIEAKEALRAMKELNIQHCEAPIAVGNLIDLKKLKSESHVPIMGDESVFVHSDAYRMLATGCIDLINIKLGKSGGICNAMKIASIAEAAGVNCQIGCFSETRLGLSAAVHFSRVWDNIVHFDLDSPLMHSFDPILGGMVYHDDWSISVCDDPGIGADYDSDFLKKFPKIEVN